MALDKDRLGDAFTDTVLECLGTSPVGADVTKLRTLMRILAEDIVVEIDEHLEAVGTTAVTSGSSVGTYVTTIPEGGAE